MTLTRLLPTKFICPPLRTDLLERRRLLQRLDAAYQQGARLFLISAPAGYGKTTLAAAWLEQGSAQSPAHAWVMLDDADNDPTRFFSALVTAARQAEPAAGSSVLSLLEMPQRPALTSLMDELMADLSGMTEPFVLALDDYQVIRLPAIHEAMERLLECAPPALRLLITSREDPPFPLSRLRARGQLCEVRLRDLRFSLEEEGEFLSSRVGVRLAPEALHRLDQLTEGWAAGLQLAGLAIADQPDPGGWLEGLNGSHPYMIEYLLEEVLKRQSEEVRQFLRRTCVLDRFNADLCDALVMDEALILHPSSSILAGLERSNLFVIPLDVSRTWFRYHHLFADVLRAGLEREKAVELHRRAAGWFAAHGSPTEAIAHALLGEDPAEAVRLIREQAAEHLQYGELFTLREWMASLPADTLLEATDLSMLQALCLMLTGEPGAAASLARQVEQRGSAGLTPGQHGRLLALQVWIRMVVGGGQDIVEPAHQSLVELDPEDAIFRTMALLALGSGEAWAGRIEASTQSFREAYELAQALRHPFGELTALANLAFNLYHQGHLREAIRLCQDAVGRWLDGRGQPLPVAGMAYLPLCALYFERSELDQAEATARLAQELTQKIVSSGMMGGDAEQILAEVAYARGDLPQALAIINETRAFAAERRIHFLEYKMTLLAANLAVRAGDLETARREAARLDNLSAALPNPQRARLVFGARLALAEGRSAQALGLLEDPEMATRADRPGLLVAVLAVKARALAALGRADEAAETMDEALRLAAPEGYRRSLLNEGSAIGPVLTRSRAAAPDFVDSLLAELAASPGAAHPSESVTHLAAAVPDANQSAVEPLSEQERRVLRLLAAGRSNADIAAELYIGLGTAKWHVHNILGKLGVASRTEAIVRARELNLDR